MKIRQLLAEQLAERMAKRPDLDTQTKLGKAAHVTQSTIWRILECKVGASVDVVESLGKAFGVPAIALIAAPDQRQLLDAWSKLGDLDRSKVLAFMEVTAATHASNMASAPMSWTSERPIPQPMVAASERAARRPGTSPKEQHEDRQETGRPAQRQGR